MAVSDGPAQEVSNTKLCLNDGLQCQSLSSQEAEQIILRNQMLQGKITAKSEKMAHLMAVAAKKEEKIRAAELKKRRQLEEKTRKELEKVNKAELKEKKKREAKEEKQKNWSGREQKRRGPRQDSPDVVSSESVPAQRNSILNFLLILRIS
ncbi:eukaryotic translation initiation factor 4 gamma-like [Alosa sapidissima]|uniref:eukaryotic translation initiation factor 4 gamma-like n=1 Tax=Alosa sapidissima TaxID=34773 RepID=UPI001C088F3A|nr:eukaryotic translation initiation factor 4 gamma-like [Alosa sapidissima]